MYYDRKRVPLGLKIRDKELLSTKHLQLDSSYKLQLRFVGPFVVQAKVSRPPYQSNLGTRYARNTLFSMLAYCASTILAEIDELFSHPSQSRINRSDRWTGSRGTDAEARESESNWCLTWVMT